MRQRKNLFLGTVLLFCLLILLSCSDDNSTKPNKVAPPVFSYSSGTYDTFLIVELECTTEDAEIFYTLDASDPTESSPQYIQPLSITNNTSIKARAFKNDYQASDISAVNYELNLPNVANPTFSLPAGTYNFSQKTSIACETPDSKIYFTLDGSDPNESSELYSDSLSVLSSTTIKTIAYKHDYFPSDIVTAEYVIDSLRVASPILTPSPGDYTTAQTVTILCSTPQAEIFYTLNGDLPTESSLRYTDPINIIEPRTIKTRAFRGNYQPSEVISGEYNITYQTVAIPTFSPQPGSYAEGQIVSLSCSTPDAIIRITLDGSEPNATSQIYTSSLDINSDTNIRAVAYKENYLPSQRISAFYEITSQMVAAPEFTPPPGMYNDAQEISITSETYFTTIYYTLDGSEPTSSSQVYTDPINIDLSGTLKARAFKDNYLPSEITSGSYDIFYQKVAEPTFTPDPGIYPDQQEVTISCATPDANIYYTLDNSEPSESSLFYTEPLNISETSTIKVRAYKDQLYPSDIASAVFLIGDFVPSNFVEIQGGTFNNGSSDVTISDFYISEHEVTQAEYVTITLTNPSTFNSYTKPVDSVSWFDAIRYCNLRSIQEELIPCYNYDNQGTDPNEWSADWNDSDNHTYYTCDFSATGYRLPTEMEWMYVAKGGNQTPASDYNLWAGTNSQTDLTNYAWYLMNTEDDGTRQVKTKQPNEAGTWDMSGNVMEWCWDIYDTYPNEAQTDPTGPITGSTRSLRGGGWNSTSSNCTVDFRGSITPSYISHNTGFRIAKSAQ